MILADIVTPQSHVARSVNLERDMGDETTLSQYILTGKGLEIISRLVAGLNGEKISAWSLTGPYGMGKSSFANFLLALCGPRNNRETQLARNMLAANGPNLFKVFEEALKRLKLDGKGLFRVAATSSFQSINLTLAKALRSSLEATDGLHAEQAKKLTAKVEDILAQDRIDSQMLLDVFKETRRQFGSPIAIVIDEFGKNLEFMARHPGLGDLFILQTLAESEDIFLWVCLHQAFEEYAFGFSNRQIQEWGKIQGRFEDITFVEPKMQMIQFIGKVLTRKQQNSEVESQINQWSHFFQKEISRLSLSELENLDTEDINSFFPLHPLVAVIVPELCVRFAQNDRTLFAFLCGGEPNALPAFLSIEHFDPQSNLATFGPELLYDYFLASSHSISMQRPESSRWIEINTIVEGAKRLPELELKILKIVGMLNMVAGPLGFHASKNLVAFALLNPTTPNEITEKVVEKALKSLQSRGILNYREYADEYRLWEGTDFDIVAAIQEQKEKLSHQPLVEILERVLPLTPLPASRHSYTKGTLRYFERRWMDAETLDGASVACSTDEMDGLLVYCFGRDDVPKAAPCITSNGRPVVIAYARCEDQIRDIVLYAAAAKAVLNEASELERDGVARREARHRAQNAEDRLRRFLIQLYGPDHPEVIWYADGSVRNLKLQRDLSALLSDVCDKYYAACPVIQNELINRNKLTSAAAKARRELMAAMLNGEGEENLSLQGTGPEVAIYRTMFAAPKLHKKDSDGLWRFVPPKDEDSFRPAWNKLEEIVESLSDEPIVVSKLADELTLPPFGIKQGPIPVIICYFLAVKSEELALYQENTFIPQFGTEEMEMMAKRPELFSLRHFAPTGIRKKVFQFYKRLLNAQPEITDASIRNASMVSVVGPLVQFANRLSPYARQTKSVSKHAQNVRNALLRAKEPIQLLFVELPEALGLEAFTNNSHVEDDKSGQFEGRLKDALKDLIEADDLLLQRVQRLVLESFGSDGELAFFRKDITRRVEPLITPCRDSDLKPVLIAMSKTQNDDRDWLSSIASAVMTRPLYAWRDSDVDEFPVAMGDVSTRFTAFEAVVKAQVGISEAQDGRKTRLVFLARPDGTQAKKIIRVDTRVQDRAEKTLQLVRENCSRAELEALLLLLSENLLES